MSSVLIIEDGLNIEEDSVYIVFFGDQRKNILPILSEAVEKYKHESEIWKKEFFEDGGASWVEES